MTAFCERLPPEIRRLRHLRLGMLLCMAALMAIGVCFVYSANSIRDSARLRQLYRSQAELAGIGLLLCLALACVDYRRVVAWSWLFYAGALALLAAVPLAGEARMGARRWIFGLQPAEFAKLATILLLARLLGRPGARRDLREFLLAVLIAAAPAALTLLQPDLGTAMVFVPLALAMLFVAGTAPRALLLSVLAGAAAAGLMLGALVLQERPDAPPALRRAAARSTSFLSDYQRRRLLDYLHPDRDPYNLGWNRRQSEIAIGSGGLRGKGFLKGDQNLLGYLPPRVSANDFIFSVLAEETGFAGTAGVLLLFAGIVFPGLRTAATARDGSGRLLAAGVVTLIWCHVFINIGMTVGLLPVTGLPLPFVSYGRSFMLTATVAMGLLQSVAVHGRRAPARAGI